MRVEWNHRSVCGCLFNIGGIGSVYTSSTFPALVLGSNELQVVLS